MLKLYKTDSRVKIQINQWHFCLFWWTLLQMKLRLITPCWAVTVALAVAGVRDKQKLLIRVWQAIICHLIFISGKVFISALQPVITSPRVIDEEPIVPVPSTVRRLCDANYQPSCWRWWWGVFLTGQHRERCSFYLHWHGYWSPGSPVITTLGFQGKTPPEESPQAMIRPVKQQQTTRLLKAECESFCGWVTLMARCTQEATLRGETFHLQWLQGGAQTNNTAAAVEPPCGQLD